MSSMNGCWQEPISKWMNQCKSARAASSRSRRYTYTKSSSTSAFLSAGTFQSLARETKPDLGDLVLKPGLRFGYLPHIPNVPPETAVRDVLSAPSPEAAKNGSINRLSHPGSLGQPGHNPMPYGLG